MGALLFATALGLFFAVVPLLGRRRMAQQIMDADEQRLIDLRRFAEYRWMDYQLAVWSVLTVVGAIFLLVRGHVIGWAWLGVATLYAAGIVTGRHWRRRLLRQLGDRGRLERPHRYRARAATSFRWLAVGVAGYMGREIVLYAYPQETPSAAGVALGAFSLLVLVGATGFLVVRIRMYLAGDDLEPAP